MKLDLQLEEITIGNNWDEQKMIGKNIIEKLKKGRE